MRFVKGEAAIKHKEYLVIGDIHLGLEKDLREKGYIIPDMFEDFVKRVEKIKGKTKKLLILGDLKHSIDYRDVAEATRFFKIMEEIFEDVILVRGNHDGGLKVKKVDEYEVDNIKFIHGNMWPKDLNKEILVMAHSHPAYKLPSNRRIPCWWIGHLMKIERYKEVKVKKVIVMPSFNKFVIGYGEPVGPIMKYFKLDQIFDLNLNLLKLSKE